MNFLPLLLPILTLFLPRHVSLVPTTSFGRSAFDGAIIDIAIDDHVTAPDQQIVPIDDAHALTYFRSIFTDPSTQLFLPNRDDLLVNLSDVMDPALRIDGDSFVMLTTEEVHESRPSGYQHTYVGSVTMGWVDIRDFLNGVAITVRVGDILDPNVEDDPSRGWILVEGIGIYRTHPPYYASQRVYIRIISNYLHLDSGSEYAMMVSNEAKCQNIRYGLILPFNESSSCRQMRYRLPNLSLQNSYYRVESSADPTSDDWTFQGTFYDHEDHEDQYLAMSNCHNRVNATSQTTSDIISGQCYPTIDGSKFVQFLSYHDYSCGNGNPALTVFQDSDNVLCSGFPCVLEFNNATEAPLMSGKCYCEFYSDVYGQSCQFSRIPTEDSVDSALIVGSVLGSMVGIAGCIIVAIVVGILVLFWRRKRKVEREAILEEEKTAKELASLNVNAEMFQIPYDSLTVGRKIGSGGSNSAVYQAQWEGIEVAFKCFILQSFLGSEDKFSEFEREVNLLLTLSHPNILKCHGASIKPPRVGIVMEFCSRGDLHDYTKLTNPSMEIRLRLLLETARAMRFLHNKNVLHRDLKPENVLIADTITAKICDFGLSRMIQDANQTKTTAIGTATYMAPELFEGHYGVEVDVFSMGVMLYTCTTGIFEPYGDAVRPEVKVLADPSYRPPIDEYEDLAQIPSWIVVLMKECWDHDKDVRPSFDAIIERFESESIVPTQSLGSEEDKQVEGEETKMVYV